MKVLLTRQVRLDKLNTAYPELTDIQLLKHRERFVPGEGSLYPRILFVGDVPGHYESKSGRALADQRKSIVNTMLRGIDLKLEHVYTSYIVKYRTQGGRDPKPIELEASLPTILSEIDVLKPCIVVTWGRFALEAFAKDMRLQDVHGKQVLSDHGFPFVPMFSPDAAMVNNNVAQMLIKDFQEIRNLV